jgi:hypothetical protein
VAGPFRFKKLLTALGVLEGGGPERARTLARAGLACVDAGRRREAIEVTERAVALYRQLADASPVFLAELAATLAIPGAGRVYGRCDGRGRSEAISARGRTHSNHSASRASIEASH